MTFLYPSFLWALFAIAIPIIIHLFNFRTHKIVYFSNVAFLDDIEQETKSRNRLKDLLILLFRILAIASLVIAFANPVKLQNKAAAKNEDCLNNYVLFLDNSFSMSAFENEGTVLDAAKSKAVGIVNSMKQNTKFLFFNNDFSPTLSHFYIKDITLQNISKTANSPNFMPASFVFQQISNLINDENMNCSPDIFYISDFQKNTFDIENIQVDTSTNVLLLPVYPTMTDNVYIDTLWFESPYHLYNSPDSMIVRIVNNSPNDLVNQPIKLFLNDTLKTLSSVNLKANSQTDVKLQYINTQKGFIAGRVEIDDYPVSYDNNLFFNYYIAPKIKVLLLENRPNVYIEKFYDDNKYFELTKQNILNFSVAELSDYQIIILVSADMLSSGLSMQLSDYIEQGGVVVVIPSSGANIGSLNEFLSGCGLPSLASVDTQDIFIDRINLSSKIYKNAFAEIKPNSTFPKIREHYKFSAETMTNTEDLLFLENGDKYLIGTDYGQGTAYLFASDLSENITDFMLNPVSVPTFYNIAVFQRTADESYRIIGDKSAFEKKVTAKAEVVKFRNETTGMEFFPKILQTRTGLLKLQLSGIPLLAGNYAILNQDEKIGEISLNYSRKESDLQYYSTEELYDLLKKYGFENWKIIESQGVALQKDLQINVKGRHLWKFFVILSLIFLLGEILVIKFLKSS